MAEINELLTKQEKLKRLQKDDHFEIEASKAADWRNERQRYYKAHDPEKKKVIAVRTSSNDGKTRVICTEYNP